VRVTEQGHLGRRGGVDLMVAMNPQTWDRDLQEIEPDGYLLYDSTKPLPPSSFRPDVHALGVPLSEIAASRYPDPKERQLLKNIMYVGVLAALLGIEPEVIAQLLGEQYKGKDKLIRPNLDAFQAGLHYVEHQFGGDIGLKVERRNNVGDRIFIEGNAASALGAVYGGATVCAWYPITPSSSLAEAFQKYCARYRVDKATGRNKYAIVQAEDELSSIGMVIGAGWNGARAFTATSGPGVSLMSEFIGLAYFAEVPAVIIDVQRGGPSTGMPTRTQQSDLLSCAYASHGDTKHVLLFPEDPYECFEFTAAALDLAERLQTPIFVMTDLDIGMNHRLCAPLKWDDSRRYDRGKVMTPAELDAGKDFGRYLDVDGDGVAYRSLPGAHPTRGAYFTRGTTKDAYARYSEAGSDYVYNMERLLRKFNTAKKLVPQPIIRKASQKTPYGVIYYGSTSPSMNEALGALEQTGLHLDRLRLRAFPFAESVERFIEDHERVFVVEQNRDAQLRAMLVNELDMDPARLVPVLHYDGTPITARFIVKAIKESMPGANVHRLSGGKAA
jgi:2-oxoglutarate ferredoxin oxidoreductase subunit alpha